MTAWWRILCASCKGWDSTTLYAHRVTIRIHGSQRIAEEGAQLARKERAELAASLIDSLDTLVDDDAEVAWQEEIARRLQDVETGKVKTIPWDEARRKGRALLPSK